MKGDDWYDKYATFAMGTAMFAVGVAVLGAAIVSLGGCFGWWVCHGGES